MELYLIRHGPALPAGEGGLPDAERPLSEDGRLKVRKAARGLREQVGAVDKIYYSPLLRAVQTAEIIAEELGCAEALEETKLALPGGKPKALLNFIGLFSSLDRVMIVGHEPNISLTAAYLLGAEKAVIEFKKGAVCRIDLGEERAFGAGRLVWHLTPRILRKLA